MKQIARAMVASCMILISSSLMARQLPPDPLNSVMWESMAERFMPDGEIVFDERVKLMTPLAAENQFHVPVTVDATALEGVVEIVAVADLNPIPLIMSLRPADALPFIGFRLKLQQTSPIHVGVRTADGVWHVAGAIVDAAGGGCTAPAAAHGNSNWMQTLGETRAHAGRDDDSTARMTLRMRHPMDTGLAVGIPAFYLNELAVRDDEGNIVAELDLYEPVSENPTLTLKPKVGPRASVLHVSSRDTEGNTFRFPLEVPAATEL
ncbi:quinoprotein dehydrogenase-associated SoxYZ-like carrier [Granulosicoccus sp. 3-233]|uniref:quinoprotein dehydrogenase-associated SoxYZ-like carrier n=1 Tax=Granulosicoccus sp. 3-233 TaxID=3417969 RepID=UPI003D340C8D